MKHLKHTTDFNSFINESAKSDKLAPLMVKAIEKIDTSLSYVDLAMAVAKIIKEEYGTHNIQPFMTELQKQLSVKESIDEMAKTDVHYKEIIAMYNSGSFAKKKVGAVVCKDPHAKLKEIEDVLGDAGYEEMIEFIDELGIKESKFKGYLSGDVAEDIAKALSYYVKGIIQQPNHNYTYLHLKNKSDMSKVIKTLKDIYGLEAIDGGKLFFPSATVKFGNDEIVESKDTDTFVGNPGEDKRMVDIRAFRGSVKDLTDFIDDKTEK
jgi:hypothetical protein